MINLDSDVVSSKFDAVKQTCLYTVRRGDRLWTVEIPLSELHVHAGNKMLRRKTVENYLNSAMSGPSDDERNINSGIAPTAI
jgi:hypothetical protein